MDKGIYCLIFETPGCAIRIGALGACPFPAGWYIYVGSAQGSGGLQRLERHFSLARSQDKQPKWHVDYLLNSSFFCLQYAVYAITTNRLECHIARELGGNSIPDFGCSDCPCSSHLLYRKEDPQLELLTAFRKFQLHPVIKTIINAQV
jgi:Uri superfamily endonuclease